MIFQTINIAFRLSVLFFLFGTTAGRAQDTRNASSHAWWNEGLAHPFSPFAYSAALADPVHEAFGS